MAKELTFDAGVCEYTINGVAVSFNPTDANFYEKLYDIFDKLEDLQASIEKEFDAAGDDGAKILALASEKDKMMRGYIDDLLGKGIANKLFKDMNCYALGATDKVPVWVNLIMVIAEEIADELLQDNGALSDKEKHLSKKYDALMAKYGNRHTRRSKKK